MSDGSGDGGDARRLGGRWRELAGIDRRSLAALRVGLGAVLLADLATRAPDLVAFYSDEGVLPRTAVLEIEGAPPAPFSLHLASGAPAWTAFLFLVAAVAAVALLVGYRTRLATAVSWVLLLSLHGRNPVVLHGGDNLLRVLLFWALFLPLGAAASLDRTLRPPPEPDPPGPGTSEDEGRVCLTRSELRRPSPAGGPGPVLSVGTVAFLLQVTLLYWTTAALKWHPAWIEEGTAVFHTVHLDQLTTAFGQRLQAFPGVLRWATFGTLALEVGGPLLAWVPVAIGPVRTLVVAVFVGFHLLGLGLVLELGIFPWVCAVAWLAFVPGWLWDRLERRPRLARMRAAVAAGLRRLATSAPVRRLAATLPPAAAHPRPRLVPQAIAAVLVVYVALWNLRTLDFERWEVVLPRGTNVIAEVLRLDQSWRLFAPYPSRDDGWYVMPGQLADGREVDVFHGGEPTYEKPDLVSATWGGGRWRKYLSNLWERQNAAHRRTYGAWVCRRWNATHPPEERLDSFRMVYMLEWTPDPGEPVPAAKPTPIWTQVCVDGR